MQNLKFIVANNDLRNIFVWDPNTNKNLNAVVAQCVCKVWVDVGSKNTEHFTKSSRLHSTLDFGGTWNFAWRFLLPTCRQFRLDIGFYEPVSRSTYIICVYAGRWRLICNARCFFSPWRRRMALSASEGSYTFNWLGELPAVVTKHSILGTSWAKNFHRRLSESIQHIGERSALDPPV